MECCCGWPGVFQSVNELPPTIDFVKPQAQERVMEVIHALGIKYQYVGNGFISTNNPHGGDKHPSFTIWLRGAYAGAWRDERDTETKGDIIDLVCYVRGIERRDALHWLANELGIRRTANRAERQAIAKRAREQHKQDMEAADAKRLQNSRRAFGIWLKAQEIEGTRADIYLQARGLNLADLPRGPRGGDRYPSLLRYIPNEKHISDTGAVTYWPCMVAGCVDPAGKVRAIHRTWLERDGSDKAPVEPPRKCWPASGGLVIPIWRGGSGLSVREAIANGLRETLVLTEGIEDALTVALAAPQYRVWAAISLGNFGKVTVPDCIDGIIIHRQSEWHNGPAVGSFERALLALRRSGRPVEV